MNEVKISTMLARIVSIDPSVITFIRIGEDRPRTHFRLATSRFPFDVLVPGEVYGIVSAFDNGYWAWKEAYEIGEGVGEPQAAVIIFKKPRK